MIFLSRPALNCRLTKASLSTSAMFNPKLTRSIYYCIPTASWPLMDFLLGNILQRIFVQCGVLIPEKWLQWTGSSYFTWHLWHAQISAKVCAFHYKHSECSKLGCLGVFENLSGVSRRLEKNRWRVRKQWFCSHVRTFWQTCAQRMSTEQIRKQIGTVFSMHALRTADRSVDHVFRQALLAGTEFQIKYWKG